MKFFEIIAESIYTLPSLMGDWKTIFQEKRNVVGSAPWVKETIALSPDTWVDQSVRALEVRRALARASWPFKVSVTSEPINGVVDDGSLMFESRDTLLALPNQAAVLAGARKMDLMMSMVLQDANNWRHKLIKPTLPHFDWIASAYERIHWPTFNIRSWLPSKWWLVGGTVVAVCVLIPAVLLCGKAYRWGQRKYILHLDQLEDQRYDFVNGDGTLIENIRMMAQPALINWAKKARESLLRKTSYGHDLYHAQRTLRIAFERATEGDAGEEFIHGCISSLGNFTTLSRGELWIQLNRHLQAFVRMRAQTDDPLSIHDIGGMRAAADLVCGDHIQVQISR